MSSFRDLCRQYFGTDDLYEVLGIEADASEKEIKKAYHRLSLLVHPDRVDEKDKATATEKFKVLGRIHSILQDPDKRRCYDDDGDIDEEDDSNFNWMDYWRAIFKSIKINDIKKHEQEYIGSEIELRDIKRAYEGSKGDMDQILEMVPFSNCDSEPRIQEIVRKMIDDGEVEEYPGFFNESKIKKKRRRSKWDEEKKEAEKIDLKALEKEMEMNSAKRMKQFSDMINGLESKYGKKRKSIKDKPSAAAGGSAKKTRKAKK